MVYLYLYVDSDIIHRARRDDSPIAMRAASRYGERALMQSVTWSLIIRSHNPEVAFECKVEKGPLFTLPSEIGGSFWVKLTSGINTTLQIC